MQEIGRIMRPAPGKDTALWLDHSGNIERFALDMFDVWEHGAGVLDASEKRDSIAREKDPQQREKLVCPECSGALRMNTCVACGWERPVRSHIHAVEGELREFNLSAFAENIRPGLRAECAKDPRKMWDAAVTYCMERSRDEAKARKWAYAVWRGIYQGQKLPSTWFNATPLNCDPNAYSLVDRETKRFRKQSTAQRRATAS
jgi:superfamily II DNA or RNA helicase